MPPLKSVLPSASRSHVAKQGGSDRELLQRLRGGDEDAAGLLYHRYARRLLAFARARCTGPVLHSVDAEDVVQSVFRSFFRKAALGMYDVPDHEELWKLLMVIALNKLRDALDYNKAAKRDVRLLRGGEKLQRLLAQHPDHTRATDAMFHLVLRESLEELPAKARHIVKLRMEGCEVAEIAARTGRAQRSVERILQAYRRKLKSILEEEI